MKTPKPSTRLLAILCSCSQSIRIGTILFLISNLAAGQPANLPPAGQIDVTQLDRYFDAEPDYAGIGGNMTTTNTVVTVRMITGKTKPQFIAVFVGREQQKDPRNAEAKWMPYTDRVAVDLGEGDGKRHIFVAARWKATDTGYTGGGWDITVQRSKPVICITDPRQTITSQPVIQLKGYSLKSIGAIKYDVFNQAGQKVRSDVDGFATDKVFDDKLFDYTTNYFQCYDILLTPGTNTIELRCADLAGNTTTTNLVYVFTTAGDTNPPIFVSLDWPKPGMEIAGSSFTARGRVDDYTAQMTGQIVAGGHTNSISGYPERNGYFWYEQVPLSLGANQLTLTATDAAGNTSSTNLLVYGVDGPIITMDPIAPEDKDKLWNGTIAVKGKVAPASSDVWINGVQATVKSDGTWVAENVPVRSPDGGGAATFEMTALPAQGTTNGAAKPSESVSTQASLGTNAMTLNASSPACGIFQLHLTDTGGHAFVLFASTNLVEWHPILTNMNPSASFDYTDINVPAFGCRFFRVVPIQ